MAVRVRLNHAGMRALLHDPGVRAELVKRGERVLAAAQASAPVETGAYKASLHLVVDDHPSRVAVHVGASVDYGMDVEADHGTLSRALDSAR